MANFAIVGATGVVGTKMIERLADSNLEQYIYDGICKISRQKTKF